MSPEKIKRIKYMIERRMEAGDPAADRRGQGYPPAINFSPREQFPKALEGHAPNIRVKGLL
jgi:hypothetical protein